MIAVIDDGVSMVIMSVLLRLSVLQGPAARKGRLDHMAYRCKKISHTHTHTRTHAHNPHTHARTHARTNTCTQPTHTRAHARTHARTHTTPTHILTRANLTLI